MTRNLKDSDLNNISGAGEVINIDDNNDPGAGGGGGGGGAPGLPTEEKKTGGTDAAPDTDAQSGDTTDFGR
ncbi:MAG: hypothetical protein GY716_17045 [bacterium]|nr:hypothetical protein [bacterium]